MMYLSRIRVGKDVAARRRLYDAYIWHRALWDAFPGHDGQTRMFLFRVDNLLKDFRVYLLSPMEPVPPPWGYWEYKPVNPDFLGHTRYQFQLRANPTIKRTVFNEDGQRRKNGRRVGLYHEEELRDWLQRKAQQSGFVIDDYAMSPVFTEYFLKERMRNKLIRVEFQGVLTVTERDRFKAAFRSGIGSAKAFGFGMLVLQPVS